MKRTPRMISGFILALLVLSCGITPSPQPLPTLSPEQLAATAQVLLYASLTQTALAAPTSSPATELPLPTAAPLPTATATTIPDEFAPDPMPMTNTGIILREGECYDLDNGDAPYTLDADCDILMVPIQILRPQNGAALSGHATMSAPSRNHCQEATLEVGDLAPNTDLYICFRSNEGHYGFIVQRHDGAPFETSSRRLVLDWWVFR